jgi:cytochrome P450
MRCRYASSRTTRKNYLTWFISNMTMSTLVLTHSRTSTSTLDLSPTNIAVPLSVLYETLRLFPSVVGIPKRASEDTVVRTTNANGEQVAVHIPKGSNIVFDTPGLHYNRAFSLHRATTLYLTRHLAAKYWDDPHSFNPSRFLGDWPRDAFLPFSGGPRACLGRRLVYLLQ